MAESVIETNIGSVEQENRNEQAFFTLLDHMRAMAHSERNKGDMFERLMCQVLAIASPYSERFSKVQLYKDWAVEHPECVPNARDIGIDLVATLVESEWQGPNKEARYSAIQCKFYNNDFTTTIILFLNQKSTLLSLPPALSTLLNASWLLPTKAGLLMLCKPLSSKRSRLSSCL